MDSGRIEFFLPGWYQAGITVLMGEQQPVHIKPLLNIQSRALLVHTHVPNHTVLPEGR
ncbi:MAG: hypothetical protein AB8W37_04995 [Arsenophonus endosymbiont of Dermacentor nuttalli]